jgi:ketosteroid isomerase-like protein
MPANKEILESWIRSIAGKRYELWRELLADDVVMSFPLLAEDLAPSRYGYEAVRQAVFDTTLMFESWDWVELNSYQTDDPEFVMNKARSQAMTVWGAPYENVYILTGRVRDGKLVEFTEYFDPIRSAELIRSARAHFKS